MKKIWDKGSAVNPAVEKFTVGNDMMYDMMMAGWDITSTLAHARMLTAKGLLEEDEYILITGQLSSILEKIENNTLQVPENTEDIHSLIESELVSELGDTGKKIHAGRSRNDQVLVAVRLYIKEQISVVAGKVVELSNLLTEKADKWSEVLMPGYTHMQIAMLSTFGMWFGTYAESLADDLLVLKSAWDLNNRNPLGTAAGYGSDLDIDREMTTKLLEFNGMNIISPYAQVSRGKVERNVASALASVAYTLSKLASDITLYNGQNFGFFELPDDMTTGSSIMPQKKNPDVVELIRGRCNRIQAVPNEISLVVSNLPSGYHRDFQLLKEIIFPAFISIIECLEMSIMLIGKISVNPSLLENNIYNPLLATNEVNRLARNGIPFRDAYNMVASDMDNLTFVLPEIKAYTHKGSPGNLCLDEINRRIADLAPCFAGAGARTLFERIKNNS